MLGAWHLNSQGVPDVWCVTISVSLSGVFGFRYL